MKGRIIDYSMSFGGKQRITLELDTDFREGYEALKEAPALEITIRRWRARRSNDANKYFHVLVGRSPGTGMATRSPSSSRPQWMWMGSIHTPGCTRKSRKTESP